MDKERIKELARELLELAEQTKELYLTNSQISELADSLASLWDSCEEFKTIFESFSRG